MVNVDKWINNFGNLEDRNQIKVAKAIMEQLELNEEVAAEGYDIEKSKVVREFFDKLIPCLKDKDTLEKYSSAFNKFDSLSGENKGKLIDEIHKVMNKYIEIQEQDDKEEYCKINGHKFGKWKYFSYDETRDEWYDGHLYENCRCEVSGWERTCSKCGLREETNSKPKQLVKEDVNKKIAMYKRKIAELENSKFDVKI